MSGEFISSPLPLLGAQASMTPDGDVPVGGVFQSIWRRKLLVFGIWAIIVAVTAAVIFQLPPYYKTAAVLLIDSQRAQSLSAITTGDAPQIDMVAVKTQVSIIQSPNLAERVVEQLDLSHAPEFASQLDAPPPIVWKWIEIAQNFINGSQPKVVPLTLEERAKTVAAILLGKVTATNDGKSYLIEINAQARDGVLSAKIANAFAKTYLDFNRKLKINAIAEANTRFFDQLPPLAEKVRDADRAVQTFRAANGLTPATNPGQADGATLADQQLAQVNTQLGEAINDRAEKEAHLKQITDAMHGTGRLDSIPEIVSSQLIQSLRQKQSVLRSDEAKVAASALQANPNLIAAKAAEFNVAGSINVEILRIATSLASTVQASRDREVALHDRLNNLRDLVAMQSEAAIKLRDLQNQADAAREVYLSYLHRFQQTASLGLMQQPDAELIALADVPLHPTGPRRMQLIALAATVAAIVAILCALLRDRFRRGFFTPVELEAATGLTVIGFIPRLRRGLEKLSPKKTQFLFREAINHVRATLEFGDQQYRARVVLVTSALPGEGKTHFSTSLARNVAERGGRALLIECDHRLPSVAKSLKMVAGNGAAVSTDADTQALTKNLAIITGVSPGLDVATLQTAQTYPPNRPSSVPSLNRARLEVDAARHKYDLIVLDGPPVLGCAEAELLCGVVDGVIMVVRWGHTTKGTLFSALRTLRVYGIHTIGAVLNNVDIKQLTKSGNDHAELYRRYADYSL